MANVWVPTPGTNQKVPVLHQVPAIMRLGGAAVNRSANLVLGVPGRPVQPGASNAGSAVR